MAGEASRAIGQTFPSERAGFSCHTASEPLGTIAAICPWNFPVVTPVRKIAPALAFGNTVVFKPSSLTPWSGVYLTQLLAKAGVPRGVVNPRDRARLHHRRRHRCVTRGSVESRSPDRRALAHTSTSWLQGGSRAFSSSLGERIRPPLSSARTSTARRAEIVSAAFLCSGQRCTAISRVIVTDAQADPSGRPDPASTSRGSRSVMGWTR